MPRPHLAARVEEGQGQLVVHGPANKTWKHLRRKGPGAGGGQNTDGRPQSLSRTEGLRHPGHLMREMPTPRGRRVSTAVLVTKWWPQYMEH